jgi:cellulose synthase/poly-beta-1,6-N-acetylglucosamine synthase-like glycosyltransferase
MSLAAPTNLITWFIDAVEWFLVLFTVYIFIVPFAGFKKLRPRYLFAPKVKFAIFVPAHNEAKVVGHLINSLWALDYPRRLFDVYVIADNCTDATADVARSLGAQVIIRENAVQQGKGYALEYGFNLVLKSGIPYDAVCVIDADNLAKSDFLNVMNTELALGHKIIQGRMDVKNPDDTWVTSVFSMSIWVANRFFYLAKHNLGLSAALGGTGMCISTSVLRGIGWGATSLTEDLEFTIKALTHGIKTFWAHDAIVYDEKPLTFAQSWRQRLRWVRGQFTVAIRYMPRLLWRGVRCWDIVALDAAFQLFAPFYMIVTTLMSVVFLTSLRQYIFDPVLGHLLFSSTWEAVWITQYAAISIVMPVVAVIMDGGSKYVLRHILLSPFFQWSWLILAWIGLFTYYKREWMHTEHTRAMAELGG